MAFYKKNDSKNTGSRDSGSRPSRFGRRRSSSQGSTGPKTHHRSGKPKRRGQKTFDPSLFMKEVKEQTKEAVYLPKNTFSDFAIVDQLKKNIEAKGYATPTPIQDQVIPVLLEGKDVIATANTGTGKTAAFLIPLINNYVTKKINRVLIITPTRELAGQIQDEFKMFAAGMGLHSVMCIGGLNISGQISALRKEPPFVIGTPGRLIDLQQSGHIMFGSFDAIVLDEVDTMLDMGFIKDIKYIATQLPPKRHSLFFSATISPTIKEVMSKFLRNPVSVSVKTRESGQNVNQEVIRIGNKNKVDVLHDLLIKPEFTKVIIFMRTKHAVDKLARVLQDRGFKVAAIHGDKSQSQRNRALDSFKDDYVHILLATDVVVRGIDIDDVSHVINYDLPQTYEDYIHRIGRTGRADNVGQAITFVE